MDKDAPIGEGSLCSKEPGRILINTADFSRGGRLLLVEASRGTRATLKQILTACGFNVLSLPSVGSAEAALARLTLDYAIIELQSRDSDGFTFVRRLRNRNSLIRIVVVTDSDSFASAIQALRAGADDYIAKPVSCIQLTDALLGKTPDLPPVPDRPLGLSRIYWEYVMRVYEQCDRNVTRAAQCLGMHRRTLQRILAKRAPPLRALS